MICNLLLLTFFICFIIHIKCKRGIKIITTKKLCAFNKKKNMSQIKPQIRNTCKNVHVNSLHF